MKPPKNPTRSLAFLQKHRQMRGNKVYAKANSNLKDLVSVMRMLGEASKPITIAKISKITEKAN